MNREIILEVYKDQTKIVKRRRDLVLRILRKRGATVLMSDSDKCYQVYLPRYSTKFQRDVLEFYCGRVFRKVVLRLNHKQVLYLYW